MFLLDLDQVRLSKVRRERRELKLKSEEIEIIEIKIFAKRSGARGRVSVRTCFGNSNYRTTYCTFIPIAE